MLESKGYKRTLSVVLFLFGQAAAAIPALQPWAALINSIASVVGGAGLVHAAVS